MGIIIYTLCNPNRSIFHQQTWRSYKEWVIPRGKVEDHYINIETIDNVTLEEFMIDRYNRARQQAIHQAVDLLLWEDDIWPNANSFMELIKMDADLGAPLIRRRQPTGYLCTNPDKPLEPNTGYQKCRFLASGFTLIKLKVCMTIRFRNGLDYSFSADAQDAGFNVLCNTDDVVRHEVL